MKRLKNTYKYFNYLYKGIIIFLLATWFFYRILFPEYWLYIDNNSIESRNIDFNMSTYEEKSPFFMYKEPILISEKPVVDCYDKTGYEEKTAKFTFKFYDKKFRWCKIKSLPKGKENRYILKANPIMNIWVRFEWLIILILLTIDYKLRRTIINDFKKIYKKLKTFINNQNNKKNQWGRVK